MNGWNLDKRMLISDITKKDMSWWLSNIDNDPCPVLPMKYKLTLKCDSSLDGSRLCSKKIFREPFGLPTMPARVPGPSGWSPKIINYSIN